MAEMNGRIRQSLAYWCLNGTQWQWDLDRICATAQTLGCESVELVPVALWPTLRRYGLTCALAFNGMPDPPFQKGVNNPRYHDEVITRTRLAIDQAADFGAPNVITFTGFKWMDAEDPGSGEITLAEGRGQFSEGAHRTGRLCSKEKCHAVPGATEHSR